MGFTPDGAPYLGSLEAPVVLEEWSDYLCPFCGRHFRETHPALVTQYVRDGRLRLVFRDLPLVSLHPTAARGHVAARCAGSLDDAPGYWRLHDALFERQAEWQRLPDPDGFLLSMAVEQGLDEKAFSACLADPDMSAAVSASASAGRESGFSGTPSFRFLGRDGSDDYDLSGAHPLRRFIRVVDTLIAGESPERPAATPAPELPQWATPEGFAPDPARPGFNMAGDAYKGKPGPLAVIAFTDFQCAACQQHAQEVQSAIDEALIADGKLLWISKHLPLRSHPQAALAAAAAECAGDQGLYWEMYDALFADIGKWANAGAEQALLDIGRGVGADRSELAACLGGRQALERVLGDLYDAQGLIKQVPAFVVVQNGRGTLLEPLDAERFVSYLQRRLERATGAAESSPGM